MTAYERPYMDSADGGRQQAWLSPNAGAELFLQGLSISGVRQMHRRDHIRFISHCGILQKEDTRVDLYRNVRCHAGRLALTVF